MGLSQDQKAMLRLLAQREEGYEDIAALRGIGVEDVRAKVKDALVALDSPGGLAEDQKAMLRLLAQREEGYEDIGALLGLGVGDVRARVRGALDELQTGEAGQAPSTAAPRQEQSTPAREHPAPDRAKASAAPGREKRPSRFAALSKQPRRLIEIGGAILVVLLLVLFATDTINLGGGDSDSDSDTPAEVQSASGRQVTQAILAPPDGGDAIGQAVFGKIRKEPVLLVQAKNLEPSAEGQSYTIWLYRSPELVLRVGAVKVDEDGGLGAQFPVPIELLSYISKAGFNQIFISRTEDDSYQAEVTAAKKEKRLPAYSGETVLSGDIIGPLAER